MEINSKANLMRATFCSFSLMFFCSTFALAAPQTPDRPLNNGDMWTYRQTSEVPGKAPTVARPVFSVIGENRDKSLIVGGTSADLMNRSAPPVWTAFRTVAPNVCIYDFIRQDTLGLQKTCEVSFDPGKKWGSDEADSIARKQLQFTVLPDEEVVVPAGKYAALKIQRDETVTEVAYPGVAEPADGYVKVDHTIYWYSPEAEGFVKIVRERRNGAGKLLFRLTEELEAFEKRTKPALGPNEVLLGRPVAPAR